MCQPVQPIYFPWPDIPFAFAESDGAIKSAAPTRNLGDGAFLTPPAKIIRTGSMQTARGTPVVPGSGGGAVGKPRDPPATSQLSHAKAAQQVVVKKEPGVDDPKPQSEPGDEEPASKTKFDKYYHRLGCFQKSIATPDWALVLVETRCGPCTIFL